MLGYLVVGYDLSMPMATSDTLLGVALVLGSAITYALYLVLSGKIIPRIGASLFAAYAMMTVSVASGVHFLLTEDVSVALHLPPQVYGISFIIALIATVLPSMLLNTGIHHLGSNKVSLLSLVGPISTIFLAWLILGEPVSLLQVIATALVLLGVLTISLAKY